MTAATGTASERHVCFGCQRQIRSGEPHIHAGLDEALASLGASRQPLGMDDLLLLAFCEPCTTRGGPFEISAHEIPEADDD